MKEWEIAVPVIIKVRESDEATALRRAQAFGDVTLMRVLRDQSGRSLGLMEMPRPGVPTIVTGPVEVHYCDGDHCEKLLPAEQLRYVETWAKAGVGAGNGKFCPDCIARMVREGYKIEIPENPPNPLAPKETA